MTDPGGPTEKEIEEHAIDHVLRVLSGLGLIQPVESAEEAEGLTPLGHALASLPVDPRIGKLVLLAEMFRYFQKVFHFPSDFLNDVGSHEFYDYLSPI